MTSPCPVYGLARAFTTCPLNFARGGFWEEKASAQLRLAHKLQVRGALDEQPWQLSSQSILSLQARAGLEVWSLDFEEEY